MIKLFQNRPQSNRQTAVPSEITSRVFIVLIAMGMVAGVTLSLPKRILASRTAFAQNVRMSLIDKFHLWLWNAKLVKEPPMNYFVELIEGSVEISSFGETIADEFDANASTRESTAKQSKDVVTESPPSELEK